MSSRLSTFDFPPPPLTLAFRMIRDQANKTLDIYLQRVRKYAQTLPETIQPVAETSSVNGSSAPRMGTPQADAQGGSWAGWAISSFTKQLGAASGQLQSHTSESAPEDHGSSSLPPSSIGLAPPHSTSAKQSLQPQALPSKSTKPNPFTASSAPLSTSETSEDQDTGWDEGFNAWGDPDDGDADPFAPKPMENAISLASTTSFDDKGEPDFSGWLSAQAQAKQASKKALPKGLSKSGKSTLASRPAMGKAASTGSTATKKPMGVSAIAPKPVLKKREEPKTEEEREDWGDAWD
jgi:SCY1-like protein 1